MSYSKKTNFYQIPYMGYGDMLTEQSQQEQMTIIDNLLYAATCGVSKCIIEQGRYELQASPDSPFLYRVKISPYDGKYTLLGIINYRLFLADSLVYSPYMNKGQCYNVYLQYTSNLDKSSSAFKVVCTHDELKDYDIRIKLCQVDWTGQAPVLITDINKVIAKNLLAHSQDYTNPHGQNLIQKKLQVTDELSVDRKLMIGEKQVYSAVYETILSGGPQGVVWFLEGYTPKFVTVYGQEFGVGQIVWLIDYDSLIIQNSGQANKKLNVKIEVEKK